MPYVHTQHLTLQQKQILLFIVNVQMLLKQPTKVSMVDLWFNVFNRTVELSTKKGKYIEWKKEQSTVWI